MPVNAKFLSESVNTNWRSGLVHANWGPGPVNTNWGPGPGAGTDSQGHYWRPSKEPWAGKYNDSFKILLNYLFLQ